jgi:hypothetical protein
VCPLLIKTPQRESASASAKKRITKDALRKRIKHLTKPYHERARKERVSWLSRPRLRATFAKVAKHEEIIGEGAAILSSDNPAPKIEEVAKKLGWSNHRLDIFGQVAAEYDQNPTIENYVRVRRLFPEVEIAVAYFRGIEALFALERLESRFREQGINRDLVPAALDGYEPFIDALCLHLLECLIAKRNLPRDGPGYIEKRRNAISDTTANYLILMMLDTLDRHAGRFRIPPSLIVLIRYQLCGLKPDLYQEYLSHRKRFQAALTAAHQLNAGERLSINKLVAFTGIPRNTAARWLADEGFREMVESFREFDEEELFKLFKPSSR